MSLTDTHTDVHITTGDYIGIVWAKAKHPNRTRNLVVYCSAQMMFICVVCNINANLDSQYL